ncbi:Pvc16 family protein [Streptomyces sp. NPDC048255]|uniref:Pvc16 family protein n=1 Tax=Streptomyces sp. NPDC048255 TaxID=3154713 RepID=UPI0033DB4B01
MAGYRALAAVGRSVVDLLNRRFLDEIPAGPRPEAVLAGPVDFDKVDTPGAVIRHPAVSVYCYRLSIDRETRPSWAAMAAQDGMARLPLRMHLLIAAWDRFVEAELEWLGLAALALESEGPLTGPLLHPSGDWGAGDAVQIVPDDLAMDSMSEAFQAMTTDYRLCLPYLARVIRIDGRPGRTADEVTVVASGTSGTGR